MHSRAHSAREGGRAWRRCLFASALALAACAEERREPEQTVGQVSPGEILYVTYCESCHGEGGRGDGPAAGMLRTPPSDLTRLWERYGSPLDRDRVAEYIDGRRLLSLHGRREMPIWGEELFEEAPAVTPGLEDVRRRLIDAHVEYLQALQWQA